MQVKNVRIQSGEDLASSIKVYWDAIEPKTPDITYRLKVKSKHYEIIKDKISSDWEVVTGLPSGTLFEVTVSALNSKDYGKESEIATHSTSKRRCFHVPLLINSPMVYFIRA